MSEDDAPTIILDLGLSEKEIFFVGRIVSQWGAIEHEIFNQCLLTFNKDESEAVSLPKEMNNLNFSDILELWRDRVVSKNNAPRQKVLIKQYEEIIELKEYRNALTHGMWHWNPSEPGVITTTRIRKKEIISMKFESDDLVDFYNRLSRIYFNIKFPGGKSEFYEAHAFEGSGFSRKGFEMLFAKKEIGEISSE